MKDWDLSDWMMYGSIAFGVASLVALFVCGAIASDCDAAGLVAGADSIDEVKITPTFRCIAKVDGRWIEVKR